MLTDNIKNEFELIRRHVRVLKEVMDNQPIGIIRLSELTHWPQHQIRYSLRVLEQAGAIEPSAQGAVGTERINIFLNEIKTLLNDIEEQIKKIKGDLKID